MEIIKRDETRQCGEWNLWLINPIADVHRHGNDGQLKHTALPLRRVSNARRGVVWVTVEIKAKVQAKLLI